MFLSVKDKPVKWTDEETDWLIVGLNFYKHHYKTIKNNFPIQLVGKSLVQIKDKTVVISCATFNYTENFKGAWKVSYLKFF
jgi:hypothetical protein